MDKNQPPSEEEVRKDPKKGDILCFDGKEWKVGRREYIYFPVPDPEQKNK